MLLLHLVSLLRKQPKSDKSCLPYKKQFNVYENPQKTVDWSKEFSDIPVFIIEIKNEAARDSIEDKIQDTITQEVDSLPEDNIVQKVTVSDDSDLTKIVTNDYVITEASTAEKENLEKNVVYSKTFDEAANLISAGMTVNRINFYVNADQPADNLLGKAGSSRNDDPAYWESTCSPLGTYKGYKFLYLESSVNVKTNKVTPGTVGASFNWGTFLSKTVQSAVTMVIDSQSTSIELIREAISNVVGSVKEPLHITFGGASESMLKTWVEGDVYIRTVLIRDRDNRMPGYAYYDWGTTNEARLQQGIYAKYPVAKRTANSYDYETVYKLTNRKAAHTPGFYGASSYLAKVYNSYKNPIGYFPCVESLNVNTLVTKILS